MHIRIYFIQNTQGGCAKYIKMFTNLFSGGGGIISLKFNRYSQSWTDFIGMLFDQAIEHLPVKPSFKEKGENNTAKNAGGILKKIGLGG